VGEIEPYDHSAAVWNPLDQPTALERTEHLADARARYAELVGQVVLAQLRTGRDLLAGNALAQRLQDIGGRKRSTARGGLPLRTGLRLLAQTHDLLSHHTEPSSRCFAR
jgi:hypothetical protein